LAAFSVVLVVLLALAGGAILIGTPRQVRVPRIVGFSSSDARSSLRQLGLASTVHEVPAPGATTGTITGQAPAPGAKLAPGSTVSLSVAEAPRWRALIAFTDRSGQASPAFRIRGKRWRIVYRMSYNDTCTFIFFCMGPTARVASLDHGTTVSTFDLNTGSDQIRTFHSGPGIYQVKIAPGDDSARWSAEIQDYY
jgi:PASTA domain